MFDSAIELEVGTKKTKATNTTNTSHLMGSASQPCDGVSADGEKDDGHVEFEGLGGAFGSGDAIAHDVEDGAVLVLDEFPGEKAGADSEP